MQKKLVYLLIGLVLLAPSLFAGQYSSAWSDYLLDHPNQGTIGGIVTMSDQVDLRALQDHLYAIHADRQVWHETVVRALQEKATTTQADLLAMLADLQAQGKVASFHGLWVGNVVIVNANPEVFDLIAQRNDVERVSPDYDIKAIDPVDQHSDDNPTIASVENGLYAIGADSCWAIGITGEGRMVSHLDTGADGNHPALSARWKGLDSGYDPAWAWYDPVTNTDFPFDGAGHGTHTMGTMCGRSDGGDTVGVAPDAKWIAAGVIDRVSIQQTVQDALTAFEWIADPDGDPSTVWDVPDVNSNSWGVMTAHGYPPCDETFWTVLDGCEAAGVVVNFAAGNEGPTQESLRRPADRATTDTKSFSVGAVDGNQFPDCPIADFSSRGPSHCTPNGDAAIKPEVSAPGVNVRSSIPGGGYGYMSGTSMATPHVSGAVALIRQANPNLSSEQVHTILMETAVDKGAPGEDNNYGAGVINVYEAVLRAMAYLQGWGTLGGVITDLGSGLPIQGARVTVQNRTPQLSCTSRADGHYFLFAPADTNWIIKVEAPPNHLPIFDTIMVTENDTIIQNYALEGKVATILKASFGNPTDAAYRSFYLKGSWDADGFWNSGWTAPAIEVRDNGIDPDQVAGDGIFTGRVLLARDMTHTYNWAIYSENYGGEASRLQDGASFTIHDLNPPNVATLSVNPSGSDHNWDIAAVGNMPVGTLNLNRVVNGHQDWWSAAETLQANVTYTFKFKVMHSNVASYGVGGVGGGNITITPEITFPYEFIFKDGNDSYIVQPVGSDGPPTYPSARSGLDGHIPVSWLLPGTVASQEMRFDDGVLVNAYYYYAYDALMANMFEPTNPVTIDSVMVHCLTEGDPYWPWPDGNPDPIGLSVYLDDGTGYPEADPVFYGEVTGEIGQDVKLDVPEVAAPGVFWVAMNNIAGGGEEGIGLDAATDYPGNKWTRENGTWMQSDLYAGDHMIYCKVFGLSGQDWMGYHASPAQPLSSKVPYGGNPSLTTGTTKANEGISATKLGHNIDRMAWHPNLAPGNPPTIADVQVAGYNLYRDTQPAPWDRRPTTKVNCDRILDMNYDDWTRCGGVDSIQNGVLYYYQISALYDIGGPNLLEVGPSDQVTATAQNHPPNNPANLAFTVSGRNVTLTWDQNTDYDLASYQIWRKDYGANAYHLTGTVNRPTHQYTENISVDGIYQYKVAAVDRGGMASSGFSNVVVVAIGTIPPRNMKASTDLEFKIHTKWSPPGTGGRTIADVGRVLLVAADIVTMLPNELMAYGDVEAVDYYDARNGTPTLEELGAYDRVVAWSNYVPADPSGLGDVLADYADNGGSVVIMMFGFAQGWGISGRIMSDYSPFTTAPTIYSQSCLGDVPDPGACPMANITDVCDLFRASVSLNNNGELIASWQDGYPLIAKSPEHPVYAINGYVGDARQFTGQMIDLLHNTLGCFGIEIQPDQYKLYKATAAGGPFNVLATLPGTQTSYDDQPVPNAVPYWYRVTAVFAGQGESSPTDTARGMGMNYPPIAPYNLAAVVNSRDVNLTWQFDNPMGDFDHYNLYKKLIPGGSWQFVVSRTVPNALVTIPVGEDGVWAFQVKAVDNGNPQLEGAASNTAFAPVGNLPPNALRAETDQEFVVPLHWAVPGLLPDTLLQYDDGVLANAFYFFDYTNYPANQFVAAPGVQLDTINVHVLTDGDPFWPWPDGSHDPIQVMVWDDDGNGNPGDMVFSQEVTGEPGLDIKVGIEGGLILNGPNFWVGMTNVAGGGEEGIGLDAATDFPQFNWYYEYGTWYSGGLYAGDQMLRASIVSGGRRLVLTTKDPTIDLATKAQNNIQNVGGGDNIQIPLDVTVAGYNIYRSTSPNVQISPGNKIRNYTDQIALVFNDSAVTNGTTYYYKVTAEYQNGPNFEESPGSNEAFATPTNHPPEAPTNLVGSVNGRDITLDWAFTNIHRDFHHYNIYKKTVPGGTWTLAGTSTTTHAVITIPAGQDGVYSVQVTAVDNGTPQLEGPPSNAIFAPVGNLPPVNLRATSNQDAQVPLRWAMPGLLPDTLIQYDDGVLANGWYFYDLNSYPANQFVAEPGVQLDSINVHVLTEGDAYWPWPDGTHEPMLLMVFDDNGSGQPGDMVYSVEATDEPGLDIKVGIEGGLILNGPNFWIGAVNTGTGGGLEGQGNDAFTDFNDFNWYYLYGAWGQGSYMGGDQMIRASIVSQGRRIQLTEKAPTIELALKNGNSSPAVSANGGSRLMPTGRTFTPAVASKPNDDARPLDIQDLRGFSIYRSTSPNVPIDGNHKIRNYLDQGTVLNFIDPNVTNGQTYYYVVTAVYANPAIEESPGSNEVTATPRMGARYALNPETFDLFTATPHGIVQDTMVVTNNGGLDLNFSIIAQVQNSRSLADLTRVNWVMTTKHHDNSPTFNKANDVVSPVNPPVIQGSGGPDAYGYSWIDSDEPGGPAVNWIDITGIGEQLPLTMDDQNVGPYDIGFEFPYYGTSFSTLNVCSNGWASFTSTFADYYNQQLPNPGYPENMLAVFWDDMYLPSGGSVWYYQDGTMCVISWIDVPHIGFGGPYSYQIVLYPNGLIQYNYSTLNDPLNQCTIGWQNGDGSDGWTVTFDADYVHSDMTINISAGWLSASPASGTVAPGGSANVLVVADGTLLANGDYNGSLTFTGSDANHVIGTTVVPVAFHLGTPPPTGCPYMIGDINNNHSVNGVDIVYAVNYFKGTGNPPPVDCFSYCPQTPNPFYAAGDVNGNCAFNGIDITYFVRYLKLQVPNLLICPNCPPATAPAVIPVLNPKLNIQNSQSGQ